MNAAPPSNVFIGCAGWSIRKEHAGHFAAVGSHLEKYASRFRAVEINSSFYRPHQTKTYIRWAASVPQDFRFAVKVPREITHVLRLVGADDILDRFLAEVSGLGDRLGPLLVQLPPSLAYDPSVVREFFTAFREQFAGSVVCEPRHISWFEPAVDRVLADLQIARVAADPAVVPVAAAPGGWQGLHYYRLHGSPQMYYSSYSAEYLNELRDEMNGGVPTWYIFDNTALGAATLNALELLK